jgi:AAA+ superfamily predicted ATPase
MSPRAYLDSLPSWARDLGRRYLSRTLSLFVVHGNVRDVFLRKAGAGVEHVGLREWLADALFGSRDVVVSYDRSSGLTFRTPKELADFERALSAYDAYHGTTHARGLARDPATVLRVLESYLTLRLREGRSIALIVDHAESVVPNGELASLPAEDRDVLVTFQRWAQHPPFLQGDLTVVLVAPSLAELHPSLLTSPHVASVEVPMASEDERLRYLREAVGAAELKKVSSLSLPTLARLTSGLGRAHLQQLVAEAREQRRPIDADSLAERKKQLIEAECAGLLEIVESDLGLDDVAGHEAARDLLRGTAKAIGAGRLDVIPMGFLICGPVGTGKSFLARCFAGAIGVPCVVLKNFRSQWQGQTEANLERILTVLKALSPVLVIVDEADAYLGDRDQAGDSGVSARVFSRIAAFMGDSEHRGKVMWALLTSRPDLLPVDLKRQGRAEEHVALFYPDSAEEVDAIFRVLAKKHGVQTSVTSIAGAVSGPRRLSGADVEAGVVRAKFRAATRGRRKVQAEDLLAAFADFVPATDPLAVEMQELAAVLECTSRAMTPVRYRDATPADLSARLSHLKALLDG